MSTRYAILSATDLTMGYTLAKKQVRQVAGPLELHLWPGELVCLLGPNGAGKSTLMRTLAGLQPVLAGQITITSTPLHQLTPLELAQKLSLVLTERIEASNLTVYELVALGRYPYTGWFGTLTPTDNAKVQEAMEAVGIQAYKDRHIQHLSDGERQKVMLARALAQDTDLIMLDEPTAHLDLPSRVEMMQLLHQLSRQLQKAILLSTHELDLALQASDKIWLLKSDGHLQTGTPEDLVLQGSIEAAFARNGLHFDQSTGTFTLHTSTDGPSIELIGHKDLVFWTGRALQREGFRIAAEELSVGTIEAFFQEGRPSWHIHQAATTKSCLSMADLLDTIRLWKNQIL